LVKSTFPFSFNPVGYRYDQQRAGIPGFLPCIVDLMANSDGSSNNAFTHSSNSLSHWHLRCRSMALLLWHIKQCNNNTLHDNLSCTQWKGTHSCHPARAFAKAAEVMCLAKRYDKTLLTRHRPGFGVGSSTVSSPHNGIPTAPAGVPCAQTLMQRLKTQTKTENCGVNTFTT
jgi:hypothetical protein